MLKLIICLVVEACLFFGFAAYAPRAFFKELKKLENTESGETFSSSKRYQNFKMKTNKLLCIELVLSAVCFVLNLIDGIKSEKIFYWVLVAGVFSWFLLFVFLEYSIKQALLKANIKKKSGYVYTRNLNGEFNELFLSLGFVYPFFVLLYQILVLLFG